MNNIVEIGGEAYKVEYTNSSYMKLDRDYNYDFSQQDFERLERQENPSFSTMFKFLALGLVANHSDEDLEEVINQLELMEFFNSEKVEVFVDEFRKAHPDPEEQEMEEDVEVGKDQLEA